MSSAPAADAAVGMGSLAPGPSDPAVIAVVDDEPIIRRVVGACLRAFGHEVVEHERGGDLLREDLSRFSAVCLDLGLPDMSGLDVLRRLRADLSDLPVLILSGRGTLDSAVEAMRLGAYDYLTKPVDRERLRQSLGRALERSALARKAHLLGLELARRTAGDRIVGDSPAVRSIRKQLEPILQSDVAVCILGESGTGKEVVARTIHEKGHRSAGPFVAINCASIPEQLQESELFGHEKGAFTGALARHLGCFERAAGGTLFLDELGDMALSTQAKLLRALQEKLIRRVGGTTDVPTSVRVVAATHKDLLAESRAGRFREDLYFRLMVYPVELPPLRERAEDIPLLAAYFLRRLRDDVGRTIERFSSEAMDAMLAHAWPGNVRELQNAVHRAMLTCAGDEIQLSDLPPQLRRPSTRLALPIPPRPAPSAPPPAAGGLPTLVLRDLERMAIEEALRRADGSVAEAARLLGLGRATLYRRLSPAEEAQAPNGPRPSSRRRRHP